MDELNDVTEEELALAAEFAEELEGARASTADFDELAGPIALLKTSEHWAPRAQALSAGRAEVERWAEEAQLKAKAKAKPQRALWLAWLPLPAVAVLALIYGTRGASESPTEMTTSTRQAQAPLAELAAAAPNTVAHKSEDSEDAGAKPGSAEAAPPARVAMKKTARWHQGEVPADLLKAQAELLAARAKNEKFDRSAFDSSMKGYRTQLLARLDMEDR